MELETVQRLKRVYDLAGVEQEYPFKRRKFNYNIRFVDHDLPAVRANDKSAGFYSSNVYLAKPVQKIVKDEGFVRKRAKGVDYRIETAIKTYKPPKPLPVKTVRFQEPLVTDTESEAPPVAKLFDTTASSGTSSGASGEPKPLFGQTASKPLGEPKPLFGGGESAKETKPAESKPLFGGNGGSSFKFGGSEEPKAFKFGESKPESKPAAEPKPLFGGSTKPFTFGATDNAKTSEKTEANPAEAKPVEAKPAEVKPFTFGANTGDKPSFTFGTSSEPKPLFGASSSSSSKEEPSAKKPFGFSSAGGSGDEPAAKKPFAFGSTGGDEPAAKKSFGFGGDEPAAKKPFAFGSTGGDEPATKKSFSFGSTGSGPGNAGGNSGFAFGAANTPKPGDSKPLFGANSSAAPAFGASAATSAATPAAAPSTGIGGFGANSSTPAPSLNQFNTKPSFNFGAGSGGVSFGANSGALGGGFNATTPFGANNSMGAGGLAGGAPNPGASNPLAGGAANPLAGGLASGSTNGRKIAPLRRRLPPK